MAHEIHKVTYEYTALDLKLLFEIFFRLNNRLI